MKRIKYGLLAFTACMFMNLHAGEAVESQRISLNRISFSQPLPSSTVYRIFQDGSGFMWFGTPEGFCRYDGYRIITFKSDHNNPNLLTDNDITSFADDDDNLWIGTKKGVNVLNKKNYVIKHLNDSLIMNSEIKFIRVTSDKSVWIGTKQTLFRYTGKLPAQQIIARGTSDLFEDKEGNIWLATWMEGLYKYDSKSGSFEKCPKIGATDNPCKIFQDDRGQMWICTWGDGLFLFNPEKSNNEMFRQLQTNDPQKGLVENIFYSIVQDNRYNYVWALSYNGFYVFEYDPNGELQPVDMSRLFVNSNNTFSEVVKDRNGDLWIATFNEGVAAINFDMPVIENFSFPEIKKITGFFPRISAIYATPNEIWFYQLRHQLGIYNIKENKTQFYNNLPAFIINSFRSYPNELWLAEYTTIARVSKDDKKLIKRETIKLDDGIDPGWITRMYEDRSNNIWCATDLFLFVKPNNSDSFSKVDIPIINISDITEDTQGNLWICSSTDGICRMVDATRKTIEIFNTAQKNLVSNNIISVCADKKGRVWIGTKEGYLLKYNVLENKITDITTHVNLSSKQILNIADDDSGNIWFSTDDKITVYNPDNGAFRSFAEADGIIVNSFIKNSYFKDKFGKLYFGGSRGICTFNPEDYFFERHFVNKPLITDVKINNKSVFQNNANKQFDIVGQHLDISPNDKNIEIDFSTLNYTYNSKICYAYKMVGLDNDWNYVQPDRQFAIFNRLAKGTYKLQIKATDENYLWEDDVVTLTINRHPAFYETWWAYTAYALITILILYLALQFYANRIKLRNELHIAQMDKDKSEELIQTKLRFFTNIGHEFRTPLTLIMTPLNTLIHQLTDESLKQKLSSIYRNAEDMLGLINQLLDFRKMEMGGEKLTLSCDDFVKFIKYIYISFNDVAVNKSIQFTFESDVKHLFMSFDKSKIRKIINNLYSNALKFTPEEGYIATTIRLIQENGREFVRVDVSDSGCGIPDKDQQMIFTRFYQSENNDPDKTGSGIGLHLVKEYVELHGGNITLGSKVGEGSVFTVVIPADLQIPDNNAVDNTIETWHAASLPNAPKSENNQEQKTLLIVEDNTELRNFLAEQLGDKFNVLEAADGKQGIDIALKKFPDLIVSDLMMPVLNGLEMCQYLKNDIQTSHIPIILLTARLSDESQIESYKVGVDSYIVKPFNFEVLLTRIETLIEQQDKRKNLFRKTAEITPSSITATSLDEEFIKKALQDVEKNMDNSKYLVDDLAMALSFSPRQLSRKFRSITGLSPNEFIRLVRLKRAAQLLVSSQYNISEIAYMVGFNTIKYFNSNFKDEFGVTPTEYRKNEESG